MPRFADLATVSRREIRAFDAEAKELVEDFHDAGWRSYLSGNGHAIMYAPDGQTTASVSGHSGGPHLSRAARADLERWLRANGRTPLPPRRRKHKPLRRTMPGPRPRSYEQNRTTHEPEHEHEKESPMTTTPRYTCPDCAEREFKSGGALALHRQRTHDGMACPECGEKFLGGGNAKRYNEHRLELHGIEPRKRLTVTAVNGEYPCPWHVAPWNCDKKFTSMSGVGSHIKVHSGQPRPETAPRQASKPSANGASKAASPNGASKVAKPSSKPSAVAVAEKQPAPVEEAPSSPPEQAPAQVLVATGTSSELDEWLGGQDPTELLANVLAVLAPPLVGQIERLRRERDALTEERDKLTREVAELTRLREEHEARMSLLREAFNV